MTHRLALCAATLFAISLCAPFAAAETGEVVIPRGEERATNWTQIPVGHQVRWWINSGEGYPDTRAEVRDAGVLASNDGWTPEGCARWDRDFEFRIWWSNAITLRDDVARFNYTIEVEVATDGCPTVPAMLEANRRGHDPLVWFEIPPLSGFLVLNLLAGGAVTVTAVAVLGTRAWQKRHGRGETNSRRPGDPEPPNRRLP